MTDWFPATRALIRRKFGPHLPPHPGQAVLGAAVCALMAFFVFGVGWLGVQAVSATWRGLLFVAASVEKQVVELRMSPEQPAAPEKNEETPQSAPNPPLPPPALPPQQPERQALPPDNLPDRTVVTAGAEVPEAFHGTTRPDYLPFYEGRNASLADGVRQADYAVVQTLARLGIDRSRADPLSCALYRAPSGERYFFQRIRIYTGSTAEEFAKVLEENLEVWAERSTARLDGDGVLRLTVDGHPTHEVFFSVVGTVMVPPPPPGQPRLTIVIDDMGNAMGPVHELLDLDLPITFSVMPRAPHAAETAKAAHAAGQEVLIHQPMEPRQAPYVSAGPDSLSVSMGPPEIQRILRANIARVPYAVGMNNHMGSRLTADPAACRLVAQEASAAGLFILDSLTHPDSVLQIEAAGQGVEALRRDLFLDDGATLRASVLRNLKEAEHLAKQRGQAVVIGHPRPETLAALQAWARDRDSSVAVVPLRYQKALQP